MESVIKGIIKEVIKEKRTNSTLFASLGKKFLSYLKVLKMKSSRKQYRSLNTNKYLLGISS